MKFNLQRRKEDSRDFMNQVHFTKDFIYSTNAVSLIKTKTSNFLNSYAIREMPDFFSVDMACFSKIHDCVKFEFVEIGEKKEMICYKKNGAKEIVEVKEGNNYSHMIEQIESMLSKPVKESFDGEYIGINSEEIYKISKITKSINLKIQNTEPGYFKITPVGEEFECILTPSIFKD